MKLTASIVALSAATTIAHAEIVTVLDPDRTIVSHLDVAIPTFSPTLDLTFGEPGGLDNILNSITIATTLSGGIPDGFVRSNQVPTNEPVPPRTPSLLAFGAHSLETKGLTLDVTPSDPGGMWIRAKTDSETGDWISASLSGNGSFGFPQFPGGSGYLGFANYELTRFGYLQIFQTDDHRDWELIGWRYGSQGEAILVENLIPAPASAALLLGLALACRRR